MAWIESHTVLSRHRKLKELARALRLKPVQVMGHLHALWHSALEQQEDGILSSWTDDLVADAALYEGDASKFVSLLQTHGWLDGKTLHDWLDYSGHYLVSKYKTRRKARLIEIWALHGRCYGAGSEREVDGKHVDGAPNLTNLTNLPDAQPQREINNTQSKRYHTAPQVSGGGQSAVFEASMLQAQRGKRVTAEIGHPEWAEVQDRLERDKQHPVHRLVRLYMDLMGYDRGNPAWDLAHYKGHFECVARVHGLLGPDVYRTAAFIEEQTAKGKDKENWRVWRLLDYVDGWRARNKDDGKYASRFDQAQS